MGEAPWEIGSERNQSPSDGALKVAGDPEEYRGLKVIRKGCALNKYM